MRLPSASVYVTVFVDEATFMGGVAPPGARRSAPVPAARSTTNRDAFLETGYGASVASSILSRFLILALGASTLACDSAQPQPQPQPAAPVVAATPPPTPAPAAELKPEDDPHYLLALEFEAAGRFVEARNEVDLAIAAGAGRDARLLAAKLAILRDDLDAAQRLLEPLASDGKDALVLYNLGLIAQRRGEYNNARTRYIAALKADPNYAATRYNLAVLTWDAGAKDEAKHHAAKFLELSPQDPRGDELRKQVGLEATPAGPAAGTPAPGTPAATTTTTPPAARPPGAGKSASKSDAGDLANPFARR